MDWAHSFSEPGPKTVERMKQHLHWFLLDVNPCTVPVHFKYIYVACGRNVPFRTCPSSTIHFSFYTKLCSLLSTSLEMHD